MLVPQPHNEHAAKRRERHEEEHANHDHARHAHRQREQHGPVLVLDPGLLPQRSMDVTRAVNRQNRRRRGKVLVRGL